MLLIYPLGDRFRLKELEEIVGSTGFRIRSRHIEAAKRMSADHRAGTFAIDIQISYKEPVSRLRDFFVVVREHSAG
jgi:hypothetical protein